MISQGEIKRKYEKLMESVATSDYYKIDLANRVNCYSCKCGHITKTKDVDPGAIPMFFNCEKCNQLATSSMFRDIAPNQKPTIEWYRPTLDQLMKMRRKPYFEAMLDHIFNGGLDNRQIKPNSNEHYLPIR